MPLKKPALKAALFDWDQTLVHSNSFFRLIYRKALDEEFGAGFSAHFDFSAWRGRSVKQFEVLVYDEYIRRGYDHEEAEVNAEAAYARFLQKGREMFPELLSGGNIGLIEGARETLTQLLDAGIPVAIVSNSPQEWLREFVVPALLGDELARRITIVGLRAQDSGKPEVDTILRAIGEMQDEGKLPRGTQERSHFYFIGDSIAHDVEAAYKAGLTPVLFDNAGIEKMISQLEKGERVSAALQCFMHAENHAQLQALLKSARSEQRDGAQAR